MVLVLSTAVSYGGEQTEQECVARYRGTCISLLAKFVGTVMYLKENLNSAIFIFGGQIVYF